jgi:hypothetical protein
MRQEAGRCISIARLSGHRLEYDGFQIKRNRGVKLTERLRAIVEQALDELDSIRLIECGLSRQELVECRSKSKDVATWVRPAVESLRSHEPEGADDVAGAGQIFASFGLCQAEIGDPDLPLRVEQEIGRLDVAVQYSLLMGILEGLGHL